MPSLNLYKKALMMAILAMAFHSSMSQAKEGDEQNQIILLNDSASALEDINPVLSRSLAQFADQKEKEWEDKNANKNIPAVAINQIKDRVKLLKAAALGLRSTYPLIAKGLDQMAKDTNRLMENGK